MISKIGAKIWMCIYNKPRDSKLYNPFTSSNPGHCLTNIRSSLIWRRICIIVENAYVKKKHIQKGSEKKTLLEKDVWLIEGSILRAK